MIVVKISVAETEEIMEFVAHFTVKFPHVKYIEDRPAESSVSYGDV